MPSQSAPIDEGRDPAAADPIEASKDEAPVGLAPHFLSRLAHDIRSPLGLLSGALEEIRTDLDDKLDEGHKRMLTLAERGLARLDRMARMLSTVAQIESRSLRLSKVSCDYARLVRDVSQSVDAESPRRGLEISYELPEGTKLEIDPERMREALWELISQSCRQAKSKVHVTLRERPDAIELRIDDDGRGFDHGQREHAFDRYWEPADKRGTGFSLSVCRDLVRLHGGDVTLADSNLPSSRPGTIGSSFIVTVPR
jgi:signal transduction histidine kinase